LKRRPTNREPSAMSDALRTVCERAVAAIPLE